MIYYVAMIPSAIWWPFTKSVWEGDMRASKIGFNWLTITYEIILNMTLQSAIGLKPWRLSEWHILGMSMKKVTLRVGCKYIVCHNSSTSSWISFPRKHQQVWKKYEVYPSRPITLFLGIIMTTISTLWKEIGLIRAVFSSSVITSGLWNEYSISMSL